MTENAESIIDLVKSVSDHYDVDIFLYSGAIENNGYGQLVQAVLGTRKRENVLLILTTNGGSANAAYQIARFLQKVYSKFYLYAPSYCKSAGTIVALGAHELIMDPFSELGPLDVQLLKQNELGARKSGLLTRSAFEGLADASFTIFEQLMLNTLMKSGGLVSFRVASEISASMTAQMMSGLVARIDPDVIGGDKRDLEVAFHYGLRLVEKSRNASPSTVMYLVEHYPAHDFIIDNEEASDLFENVSYPVPNLMKLAGLLGEKAYDEADEVFVMPLEPAIKKKEGKDDVVEEEEGADRAQASPDSRRRRRADRRGDSKSQAADAKDASADDGGAVKAASRGNGSRSVPGKPA